MSTEPDIPYLLQLRNGRKMYVSLPAAWCQPMPDGEMGFGPRAVEYLDHLRVLASDLPAEPTPAYILALREALGLTQTQLAQKLGVTRMTVARWEWGTRTPGAAARRKLDRLRLAAARRGIVIKADGAA